MCGRYYVDEKLEEEILQTVKEISNRMKYTRSGDVYPSDHALVITGRDRKLTAEAMKWGFPGEGSSQLLINARSETALDRRTFSESVKRRRCIIPTRHFYEWDHMKNKVTFSYEDSSPLYMARFYNCLKNEERFIILTTGANASMEPVHNRMPLILRKEEIEEWIFSDDKAGEYLSMDSPLLYREQEYEQLSLF